MSLSFCDTPRPFQPSITQRDIKTEVANCVGGVARPLLANICPTNSPPIAPCRTAWRESAGHGAPKRGRCLISRQLRDLRQDITACQAGWDPNRLPADWRAPLDDDHPIAIASHGDRVLRG
jgi:hypothetical protein